MPIQSRPYQMPMSRLAAQLETQSRRVRGASYGRRTTGSRAGGSLYDFEEQLRLGMQMRLREARFGEDQRMEEERRMQELEAQGLEMKYSARTRAEIAAGENAVQKAMNNPVFSEEDKIKIQRAWGVKKAGLGPNVVPADPNKTKFIPGREPGQLWEDPTTGAIMTTAIGVNGQPEPKLIVRPNQTMQHLNANLKATHELELLKQQTTNEVARRTQEIKWAGERIPVVEEGRESWMPFGIGDTEGGETSQERFRTDEEIAALSRKYFGPQTGEAVSQAQEPVGGGTPRNLIGWSRNMGVSIDSSSGFLGTARAFLDEVARRQQAGEQIPREMLPAIQEATDIIRGGS